MKKNEFRVLVSIIALILSLGVFLAAFYFYEEWGIKKPLDNQIKTVELVQKVNINEQGKKYEIKVYLNKSSDIQKSYIEIVKAIESKLGAREYQLVIKDQRNTSLQKLFSQLQPAVYESLANNKYIWLNEEIARQAEKRNMKHNIFIDGEHLFIQIYDGNHFLYEIINRQEIK
ncbi:MAG: hypothetical protein PHC92_00290 [Syntrophomonadaceae bacterium]|nr:hypothetical protein [Syntrophomonadaceae bacterium]MDD3023865.1 hypothetical protein [Syntrophomonadaceae bacterium]